MHSAHQLKLAVFTQDASWNGSIINAMTYCKMELLCWFWSTENWAGHSHWSVTSHLEASCIAAEHFGLWQYSDTAG